MQKLMKNKVFSTIAGLILGILIGGYLGLVLGGTLLGSFNIYDKFGIEGYEIATYVGSLIGIFITIPLMLRYSNKLIKTQK
ncbi:MAG: hypothetical protein GX769_00515 [Erysipelothrix sp.]|nr:hypothetical protein [Erysipelothrix sp.]